MGEHRYVQYEQIGNFAYLLSWLHLLQLFSSQKHRLVHIEPISARWQLARFRPWLLLTSNSAPLLSSCSQKKGELVLKLCRHVKKKQGRSHLSKRVSHSLPINTFTDHACITHCPSGQPSNQLHRLIQKPDSACHVSSDIVEDFVLHLCLAFNLQRLPAYLIREVILTCHILTLHCKSYFSHCQHHHLLTWKEGVVVEERSSSPLLFGHTKTQMENATEFHSLKFMSAKQLWTH